jgi:tetratricopeptide (TPR) repeat protein
MRFPRWFQDWREQRAALRELHRTVSDTDGRLADMNNNPFALARAALEQGNIEKAVAEWEQARALMPNAVLRSKDTLDFLLTLKRYDEAEALMRTGRRRFPRDISYVKGPALIAQHRGDLAMAVERWADVRKYHRRDTEAYWRGAICLRLLDRVDEAEALAQRALRIAPGEEFAWLEFARCAEHRRDWPEALSRWRQAVDHVPNHPAPATGLGRLLVELERYEEAEAWLVDAKLRHGRDPDVLSIDALCAERRGDLA